MSRYQLVGPTPALPSNEGARLLLACIKDIRSTLHPLAPACQYQSLSHRSTLCLSPPPRIDSSNHPRLPPEPLRLGLPIRLLRRPLDLEVSEHLWEEFADLHGGDVLADAGARAVAELCI